MLVYNRCDDITIPDYVCDPCENIESGRVRSLCLLKKGTTLPDPLTLQAIEILIAQGKMWVFPDTNGTFDGGTPKMVTGYGDLKDKLIGYDYSLVVRDPNYIGNRDFMQAVENIEDWNIAFRTETKLAVVMDDCTITVKNPVEESIDTDVVWSLDVKWFSKNKPELLSYPAGLFASIFKDYEYITGLSLNSGVSVPQQVTLEVDSNKSCKIVMPDYSIWESYLGVIKSNWTGIAGSVILIVPRNSAEYHLVHNLVEESSKFVGELKLESPGYLRMAGNSNITKVTANNSLLIDTSYCQNLETISCKNVQYLFAQNCKLTANSIAQILSDAVLTGRTEGTLSLGVGANADYNTWKDIIVSGDTLTADENLNILITKDWTIDYVGE